MQEQQTEQEAVGDKEPQQEKSVEALTYYITDATTYVSMRSEADNRSDVTGKLYNGNSVEVLSCDGDYWYVYSRDMGAYGYVNSGYLTAQPVSNTISYYASVDKGYLALRSEEAYASSNEIGKLYNGDRVDVLDFSGLYWYVYAPSLGRYGYVNSRYLVR